MGEKMSQYNSQKGAGAGRSRAKKSSAGARKTSRSSNTRSARSSSKSPARNTSYRSNSTYGSRTSGKRRTTKRRRNRNNNFMKLAVGGILLIVAITIIASLLKGMKSSEEPQTETTVPPETELQKEVTVDGINITGMSREDAKAEILKKYPWAMTVVWEDKSYEVTDLAAARADALLAEIYEGEAKESYSLDMSSLDEEVKAEAAKVAAAWNKKAKNGSISSYDASADKFIFAGAETGLKVNEEKLISDITSALNAKQFDASINASVEVVQPEYSEDAARQRYEKLSTFTTKTTANSNRNTNIKLAAQAINGTIIQPGQEFSFNDVVGQRTEAKGYKGAAAYNNGDVVQEIGGGVCQVSSTLYNAVVKAGLKTTVRRSHTYEPSYVTPGTDATVSWGGPDYKFMNNSEVGIGIRARYADQTLTISIYGIPILEEGVTYSLQSKKLGDTDPPTPVYEEDPTLEPGVEKVKSSGSIGSKWETRLVVKKNGEVISQEVDHTVTYKGHAPVILRNTSGSVAETTPTEGSIAPSESSIAPEGAGDGFGTESPTSAAETTAAERETAAQPTTAAPTTSAAETTAAKPTTAPSPEPTTAAPTAAAPVPAVKPSAAESSTGAGPAPGSAPTVSGDQIQMIAPNPGL